MTTIDNILKNKLFINNITNDIQTIIKRNLRKDEYLLINSTINNIPNHIIQTRSVSNIANAITNTVISEIQMRYDTRNDVDTHEMLKQNIGNTTATIVNDSDNDPTNNVEVNISKFFGITEVSTLIKKIIEPINSVNTAYLPLDTRYRMLDNDGTTCFKWSHINNLVRAQGTFNSLGYITDITSMRLRPFRMPKVASVDTPYKRTSVLLHEFGTQAFIAHEDTRYHFLGSMDIVTNPAANWTEIKFDDANEGTFKFNKPITHLDTLTISLGSPLESVIFDPDRAYGTITTYGAITIIDFTANHNLTTGDIVYITKYTTINENIDYPVLNNLNNKTGVVATVTSPVQISIPVDTSSLQFVLAGTASPVVSSPILTGVATTFTNSTQINVGDRIIITDGGANPSFIVQSIQNDTTLTLTTPYNGLPGAGFTITKNNPITDTIYVYFGSKRIFFTLELTYLSTRINIQE